MQLSGELAPLGYAHRETEFIIPTGSTSRIYGACGPDALASAASAALGHLVTCEAVYAMMRAHGLCDAGGISTDGSLAKAALVMGLTIVEHRPYGSGWTGWPTFFGYHCGTQAHPVLVEGDNCQALRDEISGLGENATNLQRHFFTLLKRHPGGYSAYAKRNLPAGYWACDGDNYAGGNDRAHGFAAADVLQFYSDATLAAARPCAAIAFARVASGGTAVWKVVSPGVVADSHGVKSEFAMAGYIESNLSLGDVVAGCPGETYIDGGNTSILPLEGATSLVYTKADGHVHADKSGAVMWALHQQLVTANATIAALKQQQPDPKAAAALAGMDALKTALAAL